MKEKMRILVVEPVKRPYVKEIDHTLEEMQKVVGGSIQALYPFEDRVGLMSYIRIPAFTNFPYLATIWYA